MQIQLALHLHRLFATLSANNMSNSEYIISLDGLKNRKKFFSSLLVFFAPFDVVLCTWGKLPKAVYDQINSFRVPCSWIRRLFFQQAEWYLTPESVDTMVEILCDDHVLGMFTWGLYKGDSSLGLCKDWDDMNVNGSDIINDTDLFKWIENLKEKRIIESCEIIYD